MRRPRSILAFASILSIGAALFGAQSIPAPRGVKNGGVSHSEARRSSDALAAGGFNSKVPPISRSLLSSGVTLNLWREAAAMWSTYERGCRAIALNGSNIILEFVGGPQVQAVPEYELPGKVNYIIGKDPKEWRLGIPTYKSVRYRDLYPGIDVVSYGNRELEFDLSSNLARRHGPFECGSKASEALTSIPPALSGVGRPPPGCSNCETEGTTPSQSRYKVLDSDQVAIEVDAYDPAATPDH